MSEQTSRESFTVRGERAPVWLPLALALVGFIGSMVAARLLLSDWSYRFAKASSGIEMGGGTTHVAPSMAEAGRGVVLDAPVPVDVDGPEAKLARKTDLPAAANNGLVAEESAAPQGAPKPPPPETTARKLESGDRPAQGASALPAESSQQVAKESTPTRRAGPGPIRESDEGVMVAEATGDTLVQKQSEPDVSLQGKPASPDLLSTQASARSDTPRPTGDDTDSEQPLDDNKSDCAPLFSVGYAHGSVKPQGTDMDNKITSLALWLSAHPAAIVYLDGHADRSGPEEVNLVISFRRAAAISALLAEAGASKAQLVVRAYGEGSSRSLPTELEPERRVTLKVESGIPCEQRASGAGGLR